MTSSRRLPDQFAEPVDADPQIPSQLLVGVINPVEQLAERILMGGNAQTTGNQLVPWVPKQPNDIQEPVIIDVQCIHHDTPTVYLNGPLDQANHTHGPANGAASVDLYAIHHVVLAANRDEQPNTPADQIYVDRNGEVFVGGDAAAFSSVALDPFYTSGNTPNPSSLDEIARAMREAQARGGTPNKPSDQVYVDQNGEVVLGKDAANPAALSSVAQDTFFARNIAAERAFVATKMPRNTIPVNSGGLDGFAFEITNRFGDTYGLFLYWSDSYGCYRVSLVTPRLGGVLDVHGGHLYPDNTLCLTRSVGSGYPSIENTYAKAALWTLGASAFRHGYGFQFNKD